MIQISQTVWRLVPADYPPKTHYISTQGGDEIESSSSLLTSKKQIEASQSQLWELQIHFLINTERTVLVVSSGLK